MSNKISNSVDIRVLKSGKTRLRFKLNERGYSIVEKAIRLTDYKYANTSLEAIGMNYLSTTPIKKSIKNSLIGNKRFLVALYPDEYEIVRGAMNEARKFVPSDADALVLICVDFILTERQIFNLD